MAEIYIVMESLYPGTWGGEEANEVTEFCSFSAAEKEARELSEWGLDVGVFQLVKEVFRKDDSRLLS